MDLRPGRIAPAQIRKHVWAVKKKSLFIFLPNFGIWYASGTDYPLLCICASMIFYCVEKRTGEEICAPCIHFPTVHCNPVDWAVPCAQEICQRLAPVMVTSLSHSQRVKRLVVLFSALTSVLARCNSTVRARTFVLRFEVRRLCVLRLFPSGASSDSRALTFSTLSCPSPS